MFSDTISNQCAGKYGMPAAVNDFTYSYRWRGIDEIDADSRQLPAVVCLDRFAELY